MADQTTHHSEPAEAVRSAPLLKDGDVVERLKQFRLRWQEDGDLLYLGKALTDAVVEIETLRRATPAPPASGGLEAVREALQWVDKELLATKRVMKVSAERGNGYANFAAHDAHKHLTAIRAALAAPAATSGEHPDDIAVDKFAAAMKTKLAKKRAEGRGGWEDKDDCSNAFLSQLLREHVDKGDPVDVGNLAMMIHQRGEVVADDRECYVAKVHRDREGRTNG